MIQTRTATQVLNFIEAAFTEVHEEMSIREIEIAIKQYLDESEEETVARIQKAAARDMLDNERSPKAAAQILQALEEAFTDPNLEGKIEARKHQTIQEVEECQTKAQSDSES